MAGAFKAYDIRGIVGKDLSVERSYWIGRALAAEVFVGEPGEAGSNQPGSGSDPNLATGPVIVSRDMRTHSPELAAALIRGLCEGGCPVIDIGLAATPMNYWANVHYGARGSVTVTASHNGPEYNGYKVSGARAVPLDYATGLDRVEAYVLRQEAALASSHAKNGTQSKVSPAPVLVVDDALSAYIDFMIGFVAPGTAPLKIGIDAANGMAGFFLPEFARRLPWLEVVPLYWELDGTFPNHEADPLKPENLREIEALVKARGCDFGVAFDGDADRCMFVDETGTSISSDLITALIAGAMLEQTPGSPIIYDLRSSHVVPEWITQHGGTPVRGRVGHTFMKRLLKSQGARFGGELSGHYYFADCFHTDSGLMAMIQVLNICRQQRGATPGHTLSSLVLPLRKYAATGEINFRVEDVPAVLQAIETHYVALGARVDHLDGLTVEMPEWWFNLRSSNTEPLLRLNLEAGSSAEREARFAEVSALIGTKPVAHFA